MEIAVFICVYTYYGCMYMQTEQINQGQSMEQNIREDNPIKFPSGVLARSLHCAIEERCGSGAGCDAVLIPLKILTKTFRNSKHYAALLIGHTNRTSHPKNPRA